jgi:hypothetical protein
MTVRSTFSTGLIDTAFNGSLKAAGRWGENIMGAILV